MTNIQQLIKLANSFCAKLIVAQNNQNDAIIKQMVGLVIGAITSVKHLMSLPKYKGSSNLINVLNGFQQFHNVLTTMDRNKPSRYSDQLKQILGSINFYSAPGNTGTGRDPIMDIQKDGYTPPAYYVNQLMKLLNSIVLEYGMFDENRV